MPRRILRSIRLLALVILTSFLLPSFTGASHALAAKTRSASEIAPALAPAQFQPPAVAPVAQNEPPHPRKLESRPQPLAFLSNAGQTDAGVKFRVQGLGGMLFFPPDE